MKYSQQEEEAAVLSVVGDGPPGAYLDIGAADGRTFSNTLCLAERGWKGLCVEPSPYLFPQLMGTYRNRPNVACLQALVGLEDSIVRIHFSPELVSTTEARNVENWKDRTTFLPAWAAQVGLATLLGFWPDGIGAWEPYSVLSIDTEGTSAALWEALPDHILDKVRVAVIEYDDRKKAVVARAERAGMRVIYENGTNVVVAR